MTTDLKNMMKAGHAPAPDVATLFGAFDALADEGLLRRLGAAFARFAVSLAPAGANGAAHLANQGALALACAILSELEGRGHSCLLLDELAADPCALLGWSGAQWQQLAEAAALLPAGMRGWQAALASCPQVWQVGELDYDQPLVLDGTRFYLRRYWSDESLVVRQIGARVAQPRPVDSARVRQWLDRLFAAPAAADEPDWQKVACAVAVRSGFSIITGGPGTGKTYTVARLLALLFALSDAPEQLRVALAAPTGKAAARLKQSIDGALGELAGRVGDGLALAGLAARLAPACTLHSLLGARPDTRALRHHAGNPLDVDVLIVDEASMIHLEMMAALLDALPPTTMLILLGDKDQLASVEAGAVLGDLTAGAEAGGYAAATAAYVLAASGEALPPAMLGGDTALAQQTVMLRRSKRFGGPIGLLAQAVNRGDGFAAGAVLRAMDAGADGPVLAWTERASPAALLELAIDGRLHDAQGTPDDGYRPYMTLLRAQPPEPDAQAHEAWVRRVLQAFDRFRILCAVREGEWGVAGINQAIEQRFERLGLISRRGEWYAGRPVMVTRNDYSLRVFNGDIGIALPDPARSASLRVYFLDGDSVRSILATRLAHVETTYAMTVHKVQGSEFAHVAMALPGDAGPLLARELVYTGITRARSHFTLLTPEPGALEQAVVHRTRRASGLQTLLAGQRAAPAT